VASNTGYPAYFVGQRLTATLLASAQAQQAWKTTSTARTSTTALADDPDLLLPVTANALYRFSMMLHYTGAVASSFVPLKINLTLPASATGQFVAHGYASTGVNNGGDQASAFLNGVDQAFGGAASPTLIPLFITGFIDIAATAGNCTLRWAQNASNATATTLNAGCWMELMRME